MHYIQKHILDELRTVESMRYARLIPKGTESGHFRYHLKQLETEGLVRQPSRGLYELTAKGHRAVDSLSTGRVNPYKMPKVITYTLLTNGNKVILYRKNKQPYMGMLNMVGGKMHEGEESRAAAEREVYEKSGIKVSELEFHGTAEIIIHSNDVINTHAVAFVYSASVDPGVLGPDFEAIEPNELTSRTDLAPDFLDLYDLIRTAGFNHPVLKIKNT